MTITATVEKEVETPVSGKPEGKRVRRSAEDARRLILDAAEERLVAQGPEGIRLQDIARDVGISHPAILHHFESREGLVTALIERITTQFRDKMLAVLQGPQAEAIEPGDLIQHVFETLSDRGTARLMSWMVLTGKVRKGNNYPIMTQVAAELHRRRATAAAQEGAPAPDSEDTLFITMLAANAAFGDAIIGRELAEEAGLDQAGVKRFRLWFAQLLGDRFEQST